MLLCGRESLIRGTRLAVDFLQRAENPFSPDPYAAFRAGDCFVLFVGERPIERRVSRLRADFEISRAPARNGRVVSGVERQ